MKALLNEQEDKSADSEKKEVEASEGSDGNVITVMFQQNKTTVIGNWKMYGSVQSNERFLEKLLSTLGGSKYF